MTLRKRCQQIVDTMNRDAIMRQGSPVETLMAFVVAETGRTADASLEETLPLCLYFKSKKEREEFIDVVRAVNLGMISRKMP